MQLIPVSDSTKKIPGRTSSATNDLIFRASLPALGFNTYFFEAKSNILFIFVFNNYIKAILFVLADEKLEKSKVKITRNDECILQNQVS